MKKLLSIATVAAALVLCSINVKAQIFNIGTTNANLTIDTNWVDVPYGIYDTTDKAWGFGDALLYQASPYLWVGVRYDYLEHQTSEAGVQAQLQLTETIAGISVTPFLEASTGIGSSSLYGSAGTGAVVDFHQWAFNIANHGFTLDIGAAADWEHVVNTGKNYNQICGGPFIKLTF